MALMPTRVPEELTIGLAEIRAEIPERFATCGTALHFERDGSLAPGGNRVEGDKDSLTISYGGLTGAFRE